MYQPKTNKPQFQMTISGRDYLFSRLISYEELRRITYLLLEKTPDIEAELLPEAPKTDTASRKERETELAEFLNQVQAKRTPDKLTAIAYFLRQQRQQLEITKADILAAFEQAMEPVPKNLNRDLRWAEKLGWIAEKPNQAGSFYLTQKGQTIVEDHFPRTVTKKTTIASTQ